MKTMPKILVVTAAAMLAPSIHAGCRQASPDGEGSVASAPFSEGDGLARVRVAAIAPAAPVAEADRGEAQHQRAETGEDIIGAAPKDNTPSNDIAVDTNLLMAMAQVNPMAAIVIDRFTPGHRTGQFSLVRGRISSSGKLTPQSVVLFHQGSTDSSAIAASIEPLEDEKHIAEARWEAQSRSDDALTIRISAQEMTTELALVRELYPAVLVDIRGKAPARVTSWSLAH